MDLSSTEARIYRPSKSAMQSGPGATKAWLLEFVPAAPQEIEPLMGWTSSPDTRRQLRLWFDTKEEAVAYAERNEIPYVIEEPQVRRVRPKSYADNFRYDRIVPWSH